MKIASFKTILIPAMLFFLCNSASAQSKKLDDDHENFFRVGAKAGVNINKIRGMSYKDGFNYNFQGGGFLQFNFSRVFGIQPEVNFVQSQAEFSDDPNTITDDLFNGGSQHKAKLNYLEVPVLLNVNLGPSKRVKLQMGPAYGGLLKQSNDQTSSGKDLYKKGEWSAIGGLWLQLPLINISARYKIGLSDVNDIANSEKWRNQAIQIGVGFTL